MRICICIPVYNDWNAARLLLDQLDQIGAELGANVEVLFVDDGSSDDVPALPADVARALARIRVLRLRRNLGHQRAIAIGLTYLYVEDDHDVIVVMDGDGEDAPKDIPTLLTRCGDGDLRRIVFAQRKRRSEGLGFRLGYQTFKLLHVVLTGRAVEVGNFSVVPRALLSRLVSVSELWNHYAAAIYQARLPTDMVPLPRARRIAGEPRMNFTALVTHGLSAISVYSDTIGVRLLVLTALAGFVSGGALAAVIGIRALTDLAIPGWATNAVGLLVLTLLNLALGGMAFALFALRSRMQYAFLPLRDYSHFVLDCVDLRDGPARPS
jgi:glycosyltransferase involved in cell wall biosynthesis